MRMKDNKLLIFIVVCLTTAFALLPSLLFAGCNNANASITETSYIEIVSNDVEEISDKNISANISTNESSADTSDEFSEDISAEHSTSNESSDTIREDTSVYEESDNTDDVVSLPPAVPQTITDTNITDDTALEVLDQIVQITKEYNMAVSYIYEDYYYSINGTKTYASASTIKAIYCQYLLHIGVDFDEKIVFETNYVRSSASGKLTEEHKGEEFTIGELIKYTIEHSDNMAYRLLFSKYGYNGFNEYVKNLGIPGLAFDTDHEFTQITAVELSTGMWEVLEFSFADKRLVEHLINAKNKRQIARGTDYTVASKYGYNGGTNGYHDTAIVFAPEPYCLTIMSNLDPSKDPNLRKPFAAITELTDELHKILCTDHAENSPQ